MSACVHDSIGIRACERSVSSKKALKAQGISGTPHSPLSSHAAIPRSALRSRFIFFCDLRSPDFRLPPLSFRSTYLLWLDILHRHHVVYTPRNWPIL